MLTIPGVNLVEATVGNTPENYILAGHHASGKSNLAADALKFYQSQGKQGIYIVTPGEDPYMTVSQHDLGPVLVNIEKIADFDRVIDKVAGKVDVIVMDSLKGLNRLAFDKAVGKDKYPKDSKEWAPAHEAFVSVVNKLKAASPVTIMLVPSDRSTDSFVDPNATKPNLIACDLPGKSSVQIQGAVSYLGYMESTLNADTKQFAHSITFVPQRGLLTLARGLRRQMTEPIALKGIGGNWERIQEAFEAHRREEG